VSNSIQTRAVAEGAKSYPRKSVKVARPAKGPYACIFCDREICHGQSLAPAHPLISGAAAMAVVCEPCRIRLLRERDGSEIPRWVVSQLVRDPTRYMVPVSSLRMRSDDWLVFVGEEAAS
jgi:hypothetical protein